MNETITTLEWEDKESVKQIDLPTLRRTAGYELATGKMPKSRPIEHFKFIEDLSEDFNSMTTDDVWVEPIYISKRQTARVGWDTKTMGDRIPPLDKFLVKRCITRLMVKVDGEETNSLTSRLSPTVSICYNELGIEVAFGVNNSVCSNMTIMGSDKLYRTYGRDKIEFDTLQNKVRDYFGNLRDWFQKDCKVIRQLEDTILTSSQVDNVMGELLTSANIGATGGNYDVLNVAQLCKMTQERIKHDAVLYNMSKDDNYCNGWELINWGTEYLKPKNNEMIQLMSANNNFHNYILDKLNISYN
jgi:hypothetical protein